jgi:hypothetical protein
MSNVASRHESKLEVIHLERGYGNDPVNNKVRVLLTVNYETGEVSITPTPLMEDTSVNHPHYRDNPLRFTFLHRKDVFEKWEAIARLIGEAVRMGKDRLEARDNPQKAVCGAINEDSPTKWKDLQEAAWPSDADLMDALNVAIDLMSPFLGNEPVSGPFSRTEALGSMLSLTRRRIAARQDGKSGER